MDIRPGIISGMIRGRGIRRGITVRGLIIRRGIIGVGMIRSGIRIIIGDGVRIVHIIIIIIGEADTFRHGGTMPTADAVLSAEAERQPIMAGAVRQHRIDTIRM